MSGAGVSDPFVPENSASASSLSAASSEGRAEPPTPHQTKDKPNSSGKQTLLASAYDRSAEPHDEAGTGTIQTYGLSSHSADALLLASETSHSNTQLATARHVASSSQLRSQHQTQPGIVPSLEIKIPRPARRKSSFVLSAMTAATSNSLRTTDTSPLTPLEESVFRKTPVERDVGYSILNDNDVLKMCDDDVEQAAFSGATTTNVANPTATPHGLVAHGWRIDNVIDKYGNRIASGSKRLARMMVQRKAGGSSEPSYQPYQHPSTSHTSTAQPIRIPLHLLPNKHSAKSSPLVVSDAQSAHSFSPRPGYTELAAHDTNITSTSNIDSATPASPVDGVFSHGPLTRNESISNNRTPGRAGPYKRGRARRKQGSSLDSATAFLPSRPHGALQTGGGDGINLIAGPAATNVARGTESESFELENYSAGDSTSTILHRGERAGNEDPGRTQRWWQSIFHKVHARSPSASQPQQQQPRHGHVSSSESPHIMPSTGAAVATTYSPRIPFADMIGGGDSGRRALDRQQRQQERQTTPRQANGHYRRIKDGSSSTTATSNIAGYVSGANQATGSDTVVDGENKASGTERASGPFRNAMHKLWAKITEFVMPGGYNRFGARDGSSYTEWIGFLVAFALASVAFIMWGTLVPKALCSTNQTFTIRNVEGRRFVAANGIVSDFLLSQNSFGHSMRGYAGYDISSVFPMLGQLSPDIRSGLSSSVSSILEKCVSDDDTVERFMDLWRENSTLYRGSFEEFPELCPFPQSPQTSGARCLVSSWPQFVSSKVGMLKINETEIKERHASPETSWVIINDMVYDVSLYVKYTTDPIIHNGTVDSNRQLRTDTVFLPKALTQLFIEKPGMDISKDFRNLDIDTMLYQQCMDNLFLRGTTQTTKTPFACANTNIVAWVTFGLYFLVLFSRMVIAEIYGRVRTRKAILAMSTYERKLVAADPSSSINNNPDNPATDPNNNSTKNDKGNDDVNLNALHRADTTLQQASTGNGDTNTEHNGRRLFLHSSGGNHAQNGVSFSSSIVHSTSERNLEAGVSRNTSEGHGIAKCLIVVPCFQESLETLTRTLQSVARSIHADSHKILWVINDGDSETLGSIMQILAHSGHVSDPKFYGAYSVDVGGGYGSARVYSGFYECGRHRIPYIVTAKDIYQGKVDTLMMILNFFRSMRQLHLQRAGDEVKEPGQQQLGLSGGQTIFLEEEVEACLTTLGHPPTTIDYCIMIDGSVQIDPLALTQFVARMDRNSSIIALSGSMYPVGRPTSLLHIIQFVEFHLRYFVSPICESFSHVTCPLDQLFTMYRVDLVSGGPCLGDDDLVASMDSLMKSSVRCRHRTWPGNDCLLVPRMARRFPQYHWSFEPNARAEIELVANKMVAFDPYERQWFRTRLVTLIDITRGRLRKRTWPIMFAHLVFPFVAPAATCMLYLEIVISLFGDNPAIVVSELTAGFVAATLLLFLASGKWRLSIYFIVYSVIALPFYHVWIPVTSFFTMNRIWYPPEQLEAQAVAAEAQIQPPENFEAIKSSYMRRFSSVRANKHQRNNSSQSSTGEFRRSALQQQQQQHARTLNYAEGAEMDFIDGGSSDSDPELVEYPNDLLGRRSHVLESVETGLGLGIGSPKQQAATLVHPANLSDVVVSSALMSEAKTVLLRVLRDYPQGIEPESSEFYVVCERVLMVLIPAYPSSTVAELAVAVDRAVDDVLKGSSHASTSTITRDLRTPMPPITPSSKLGQKAVPRTQNYAKQGNYGRNNGRPVSVIMEESDVEQ